MMIEADACLPGEPAMLDGSKEAAEWDKSYDKEQMRGLKNLDGEKSKQ